jgi:hypothetical protein
LETARRSNLALYSFRSLPLHKDHLGRSASFVLAENANMELRNPSSFLQRAKQRILQNNTLRFLLFQEKEPKHRVMHSINTMLLGLLSLSAFIAAWAGFTIWGNFGFVGFMFYYFAVIVGSLELFHCLFDR